VIPDLPDDALQPGGAQLSGIVQDSIHFGDSHFPDAVPDSGDAALSDIVRESTHSDDPEPSEVLRDSTPSGHAGRADDVLPSDDIRESLDSEDAHPSDGGPAQSAGFTGARTPDRAQVLRTFGEEPQSRFLRTPEAHEIEGALATLMKRRIPPTEQMRRHVMQLLIRRRLDAVIDSNYDVARQYDEAAEVLQQDQGDTLFEREERIRKLAIDDRSDVVFHELQQTRRRYELKLEQLAIDRERVLEELKDKHAREVVALKQKWQNPAFLAKYQRPSAELIQMRYIERRLALSRCYDEAKAKREVADRQQQEEEQTIAASVELLMQKDWVKMRAEQADEIDHTNRRFKDREVALMLQQQRDIEPLEYALRQMYIQKNTTPNRKLRAMSRNLTKMGDSADPQPMAMKSPRTAARMAAFRSEKAGELRISPVADHVFHQLFMSDPVTKPFSNFRSGLRRRGKARQDTF
jgi:hypothetical protein